MSVDTRSGPVHSDDLGDSHSLALRGADAPRSVSYPTPSKRTETSLVRFTPAEFRTVSERARECGLPPARFIREAALGAVPKARRAPANAELIRHLAHAGTVLQQLAGDARERANAPAQAALEGALSELLDVIRRVE